MEQERSKPPRPKHRTNVPELPPPPNAPQLTDFIREENVENKTEEVNEGPSTVLVEKPKEDVDESKENREVSQESEKLDTGDKSQEANVSASSFVRELPLDALLPQPTTKVPASVTLNNVVAPPMYPKLEKASTLPQIAVNGDLVKEPTCLPPKTEHPRIYPSIQEAPQHGELMNEAQLLQYYQNEQLDFVDDFVDEFVSREINPRNSLYNLIEKFKSICEQIQRNEDTKKALSVALEHTNNEVWSLEDHKISRSGRCGDDRAAAGEASFKKAKLVPGKLTELNQHLSDLTKLELDDGFCLEIRARSLALQIQWIVVKLNKDFLAANNINTNTVPTLISTGHQDLSRSELIGALSDLFFFLRFPLLPARFRNSVDLWVIELSSVLLKLCTLNNQLFLTAQILRLPSPIEWAVPLLQTYISIPNLDMSKPIDLFMALLSMILQPVHKRDEFLIEILKYYEGENAWDIIDENGEEDTSLTQLNDVDIIGLLGQFNFKALYLSSFQRFNAQHQGNRLKTMLSLISFTLILLKVLNEGLITYSHMKNVCKKICEFIRKAVQYVCVYWKCSADTFGSERHILQNEINRIILQAAFYIVSKKSMGLWQFLVEFPFSSANDFCRLRCQVLLRNPTGTTVAKLYEINDAKLEETLSAKEGQLENSLDRIGVEDRPYALATIGAIISSFENVNIHALLNELLAVCFFDEQHRDQYSKVGGEAISVILEKNPYLLSHILKYIDRRMDHLDTSEVLSAASLVKCQLSSDEVGSLLGKWLINRPINHPASIIARRVLTSLDWGAEDDLFLPRNVHDTCAETIVKAHVVHCKNRNSLIHKSVAKATKLALKCPDYEQNFDKFCHDLLIRLKISEKPLANDPQTDLTAFYVFLIEKCLSSPEKFMENGLEYWIELVNSACFNNAVIVLVKLAEKFPSRIHLFIANESFKQALERLLHADESYYAVQLIMGADKFPGPTIRMISCAISNQLKTIKNEARLKQQIDCWFQLLTCKKYTQWNEDKFVLHLLDIISQVAFANDPSKCLGLIANFVSLYQVMYTAWQNAPKGMLGWFSTQSPSALISTQLLGATPWLSFLLLQAEHQIYSTFYTALYQNLGKHPERTLEEAVKRAATKSNIVLGVDRLNFYRWIEFCTKESVISSEVYPLALQQLCIVLFKRENFSGKKFCPGERYFQCKQAEPLFTELRDKSLPTAEKHATFQQSSSFIRSAGQWIFNKAIYNANFNQFNSPNINMDYLLQMIISNDINVWTEFVNIPLLHEQIGEKAKLFMSYCQLLHVNSPKRRQSDVTSLTEFFRQMEVKENFGLIFPEIPLHQNLPKSDYNSIEDCYNMPVIVSRFNAYIGEFSKLAKLFMDSKDKIAKLNTEYNSEFQKLYNEAQTTLIVQLKCGNFLSQRCTRPTKVSAVVNASQYNGTVAQSMNTNREAREAEISQLLKNLDSAAIQSAQMEYFCWMLAIYTKHSSQQTQSIGFKKGYEFNQTGLHSIGLHLFYRLLDNNIQLFLFPALISCFENCLYYLGRTFIRENPNEQMNLLRLVLAGNPLNVYIIENFTPHCVPADLLLSLYGELSTAVRNSSSTEASLALMERLDIENSSDQLPPMHFTSLMPIIFENMASVPASTKLHKLCVTHFEACMFHSFPNNFVQGLRLLLSGFDSRSVPLSILTSISSRLQMDEFISQTNSTVLKPTISIDLAKQSVRSIAEQLAKSRRDLATNLFSVWLDYLESICKFTDFFIRTIVVQEFSSEAPQSVIEFGLRDIFIHIVGVWSSFMEPVGLAALAPWNPSDNHVAETIVVQRFVDLLIWLPHSTYLPPGAESCETLFWQYFVKKLLTIQKAGSSHVYGVYENQFTRLHWARFWPNLLDLSAIDQGLSSDVGQLITEILIRIQWPQIVQQMNGQPEEAFRAFYSLLLSIFSRCVKDQKNYAKSRASFEKLLSDFFVMGKWYYVKVDTVEKVSNLISTSFSPDRVVNSDGPLNAFNNIWREVCFFSTTRSAILPSNSVDLTPKFVAQKQALYIRSNVHTILRSSIEQTDKLRQYKELLDKCYLLIGSAQNQSEDLRVFSPIAKELIAFWPEIPKQKFLTALFETLINWMNSHDSLLILLFMDIVIETLGKSSPQIAFNLLEDCIFAYFKKRLHSDWNDVCKWMKINEFKEWVFTTPSSESEPRFLTLNAHLLNEMQKLSSAQEEEKLSKRLSTYLESIKPKYITPSNESAFVVCLEKWQRMVIRQFSIQVPVGVANERLEVYLNFLRKITSQEKGVSLFNVKALFGKKQSFPIKLQLLASIISLYITQQQTSFNQPPRTQNGQAVLNSRISAFKDLQQVKAFQEIENVTTIFQFSTPYFTQTESHTLMNVGSLFFRVASQLYPESQKLLLHLDS